MVYILSVCIGITDKMNAAGLLSGKKIRKVYKYRHFVKKRV